MSCLRVSDHLPSLVVYARDASQPGVVLLKDATLCGRYALWIVRMNVRLLNPSRTLGYHGAPNLSFLKRIK